MEDQFREVLRVKGPEHEFGLKWMLMVVHASIVVGTFDNLMKLITEFAGGDTTFLLEELVKEKRGL